MLKSEYPYIACVSLGVSVGKNRERSTHVVPATYKNIPRQSAQLFFLFTMSIQSIKNSFRFINTTSRPSSLFARQFHARTTMSAQVPSSHDISAVAKDENGPVKGSQSAQMQSEVGKTQVRSYSYANSRQMLTLPFRTSKVPPRMSSARCRRTPAPSHRKTPTT